MTRVRAMAGQIGYVTNHVARALKGEGTRTIGLLTANIANSYYTTLPQAIQAVARVSDYQVLTGDATEDGECKLALETAFVQTMLRSRICAVIVTYGLVGDNLKMLDEFGVPLVFVDTPSPPGYERIPSVWTDNRAGGLLAGEHFAAHGYRRWLLIGHLSSWATRQGREQGFLEAASRHGADAEVLEGGNTSRNAYQAMASFLRRERGAAALPDALFATNGPLLHGTLTALAETALRPGTDLGVIGFDDFDRAPLLTPPVTVVDQRVIEMGTRPAELLVETLEDGTRGTGGGTAGAPAAPVVLPPHLTVRRSCGCGPAGPGHPAQHDSGGGRRP